MSEDDNEAWLRKNWKPGIGATVVKHGEIVGHSTPKSVLDALFPPDDEGEEEQS